MLHLKSFLFLSLVLCPALPFPVFGPYHLVCPPNPQSIPSFMSPSLYLPTYFSIKFVKKGKGEVAMCPEELKLGNEIKRKENEMKAVIRVM